MELVRGWKVLIEDIEIKNETNETIQPFVQFIIGGDYYVSIQAKEYTANVVIYVGRHHQERSSHRVPVEWNQGRLPDH